MPFRIETIRIANAIINVNVSYVLKMCLTPFRVVWLTAYRVIGNAPRGTSPRCQCTTGVSVCQMQDNDVVLACIVNIFLVP